MRTIITTYRIFNSLFGRWNQFKHGFIGCHIGIGSFHFLNLDAILKINGNIGRDADRMTEQIGSRGHRNGTASSILQLLHVRTHHKIRLCLSIVGCIIRTCLIMSAIWGGFRCDTEIIIIFIFEIQQSALAFIFHGNIVHNGIGNRIIFHGRNLGSRNGIIYFGSSSKINRKSTFINGIAGNFRFCHAIHTKCISGSLGIVSTVNYISGHSRGIPHFSANCTGCHIFEFIFYSLFI